MLRIIAAWGSSPALYFRSNRLRPSDVPGRVHTDGQRQRPELGQRTLVEVDERGEALALTTDDGDHQWKPVLGGSDHRARAAADAHPRRQRTRVGARVDL